MGNIVDDVTFMDINSKIRGCMAVNGEIAITWN
jgi:hypothetical protein